MSADFTALLPILITSATAFIVMIAVAIRRNHQTAAVISLVGLTASLASLRLAASAVPRQITPLLILDSYSLLYMAILLCAAAFVFLFGYDYLKVRREHPEELYILVLLATTGAMILAVSSHFTSLFLGLELLSVALYALIAYVRTESVSVEAAIKYLVLAASSSSFLLFGLALIYAVSGSMELSQLPVMMTGTGGSSPRLLVVGVLLTLTGVGFKLAIVPFHFWTPDVYEGAPLPVTAFIATVSKGGTFALFLRWFHLAGGEFGGAVGLVLSAIAIASMLAGNLLALRQRNLKRILAYSSIAHMGYLLTGLLAGGSLGPSAATYYLTAYLATILGAFGVMTVLSDSRRETAILDDYRGLFWRRPGIAGALTVMMLSLAGVPLTAGFLGKFYVIAAGASQSRWALLFTLVVGSTIGLFYYLRVIFAMYAPPEPSSPDIETPSPRLPVTATLALLGVTALVILLGTWPAPVWEIIRTVTRDLG